MTVGERKDKKEVIEKILIIYFCPADSIHLFKSHGIRIWDTEYSAHGVQDKEYLIYGTGYRIQDSTQVTG